MTNQAVLPPWMNTVARVGAASSTPFASPLKTKVWNRTGATVSPGMVLEFDCRYRTAVETSANASGRLLPAVSNALWGDDASCWRNVCVPTSGDETYAYYCVANGYAADNEELEVIITGQTYLRVMDFQGYFISLTDATWTESSKTITKVGAFTTFTLAPTGATAVEFVTTSGANVLLNTYTIASKTSNDAITLSTSLSGTAADLGGVVHGYVKITYPAGSKLNACAALNGARVDNTAGASTYGRYRRIALLEQSTELSGDSILTPGQLVLCNFCGFGITGEGVPY